MLKAYPKYDDLRSGCKVSWLIYASRDEAEKAAEVAQTERDRLWALGYDFGYCSPGFISPTTDGRWEVCIP